jgi:hypothetical protein
MKYQLAVADFKKVLALEPHNDTVRSQLVSTQKLIRKIEFEKVDLFPLLVHGFVLMRKYC